MIPFLCNNISVYVSLLELIVKVKVLENVESYDLLQVVNNNDNLLQTKRIHVGFAAESEIKRLLQTKQVIILYLKCGTCYYNIMLVFNFPLHFH